MIGAALSTERVFSLPAFEGVRLIRLYQDKYPETPITDLVPLIAKLETDGPSLDLEASAYLHGLVERNCPLQGQPFYQACITAVVTKHQPIWLRAMRQGRVRFMDTIPEDDRDIFEAAGVLGEPPSVGFVAWWDSVVGYARLVVEVQMMEQARAAEKLTIDFEIERLAKIGINKRPIWKGLDDNFAGYDVLSYELGESDPINKLIEVKSTTVSPLRFRLTRNEWDQALKFGKSYVFHIWDMAKTPPVLHVRTIEQVAVHIPIDNQDGKGKWTGVDVPVGAS